MQRIIERDGLIENESKQRINAQMSMKEKVKRADFLILNNGKLQTSIHIARLEIFKTPSYLLDYANKMDFYLLKSHTKKFKLFRNYR